MIDIYDMVTEEELSPDLKMVSVAIGLEGTKKLLRNLAGMPLYIPKLTYFQPVIKRYLKEKGTHNIKETAKELRVSLPYLNKLMKEILNAGKGDIN